jgi:hypothetical protein
MAMFLAAAALAAPPSNLENRANQIAARYQRAMPMEAGNATIVRAQAVGTTVMLVSTVREGSGFFEANKDAHVTTFCQLTSVDSEFLAAGGKIQWVLQFSDGTSREVTLTRENCAPAPNPAARASRDELRSMVALIRSKLPMDMGSGLVLKGVRLDGGTHITYDYGMEKMVSQENARRFATDDQFLLRMNSQLKEKCNDATTRTLLQRGVTYTHNYKAYGIALFSGNVTKEYCGM